MSDMDMGDVAIQEPIPADAGLAAWAKNPLFWLVLAVCGLAAFVYGPLFLPPDDHEFAAQGEEFFFEASQSAGAPVLMLGAWLFYRRSHYRDLLTGPGSRLAGGLFLLLTVALYTWGTYTAANDLRLASAVLFLTGTALLLGGGAALRAYWLPILFLLFALPLPPVLLSAAMFPIQLWTASFAGALLNAIGVQSFVQGDQILRPENTFIVIETCSGVRTVVTLSMLTVLLIDLFERRGWHALILAILTPFVALLTNGLRVVTLVLNPHSSIHSIHNLQGIAMLLVGDRAPARNARSVRRGRRLRPRERVGASRLEAGAAFRAARRAAHFARRHRSAGAALVQRTRDRRDARRAARAGIRRRGVAQGRADLQFSGSVRHLAHARRRVEIEGVPVDIHLGVADEQERRFTILSPRLAWPDSGHATVEQGDVALEPGGRPVRRMVLRRGARSLVSYSWYERRTSLLGEWWRQAAALDRSPFARPEHILAIRISTPLEASDVGGRAAEERVRRAWSRLAPELVGYAPTRYQEPAAEAVGTASTPSPAPPAPAPAAGAVPARGET
jgi:exosortase